MENYKLQKSSGLLFSSDLIWKLFVALIVVFIPGLILAIIEKYDKSYLFAWNQKTFYFCNNYITK